MNPDDKCRDAIEKVRNYARDAGRDPKKIGIEGRISHGSGSEEAWRKELQAWQSLGATHASFNTMKANLRSPAAHIDALRRFKAVAASVSQLRVWWNKIH
jgi:alkanesulfonate monooxygenase SsuD/methylene tetrahydromethanopterin reductase-like flavin-dependent oxidoreductase (luciferase family)